MARGKRLSVDQKNRIGSYFSRNYVQGEKVQIQSRKKGEDWFEWMEGRLRDIGFYNSEGIRVRGTDDAPPRIFLRGDATMAEERGVVDGRSGKTFSGKSLSHSHMEFKVWLQHKVEEARLGYGSVRFLSNERDDDEYEEYKRTMGALSGLVEGLMEDEMLDSLWPNVDNRHLNVMRKVIGRADPDPKCDQYDRSWHMERGTLDKPLPPGFEGSVKDFKRHLIPYEYQERRDIVSRISEEVVKSLISTSKTSPPSDREVFRMRANADPKGFISFASSNGIEVGDDEVKEEMNRKLTRDFQFGKRYASRYRRREMRRLGMDDEEYIEDMRVEIVIGRLVGKNNPIEPPDKWKWVKLSCAAIVLLPNLAARVERAISASRERLAEIIQATGWIWDGVKQEYRPKGEEGEGEVKTPYRLRKGLSPESLFDNLSNNETKDIHEIINKGFGGKQGGGETGKGPEEADRHNSRKLAYNLMTMLQNHGYLTTKPMSVYDYVEHFLGGDDTRLKPREGKRWPNSLIFTESLLEEFGKNGGRGKVEPRHFSEREENAIFRVLRGERARWMYCPPEDHATSPRDAASPGGYLKDEQDGRVTDKYQFKSDYEGFTAKVLKGGEEVEVPTRRCIPDSETADALNALQRVQWEVNLDLLEKIFEIEMYDGKTVSDLNFEEGGGISSGTRAVITTGGSIKKIQPKVAFEEYFTKDPVERQGVDLSLDWSKKIINHNANVFWHPWFCDFRGRMIPRCTNLSPQGGDLDKALIRFKHWKPMGTSKNDETGFGWLQVHVHNLMEGVESGLWEDDKAEKGLSFEERREWVNRNEEHLREIARNPREHVDSLGLGQHRHGRREDLQRVAALIEFDRVLECYEGEGRDWTAVKSGMPVHLDASCNGYQHVSTLLRHPELARLVNVIPSERPQDLYEEVALVARENHSGEVRKFLDERLDRDLADRAFDRIFDRKMAKLPTMTRVYGAKDFNKAMAGKSGKGASYRSAPQKRKWDDKQRGEIERISTEHQRFIIAREEWLEDPRSRHNRGGLELEHYQKHAVVQKTNPELQGILDSHGVKYGKKDNTKAGLIRLIKESKIKEKPYLVWNDKNKRSAIKAKAKAWMKLLKEEEELSLWAEGSGLYRAILEDDDLRAEFWYDNDYPDSCGRLWKEQPRLTSITVKAYKGAIKEVTGVAYKDFEDLLKGAAERSGGKYPGVGWRVSHSDKAGRAGFEVCNYYMKHMTSGSKAKWPSHPGSCYSNLLPDWYSETKKIDWHKGSTAKSTERIEMRLRAFIKQAGKTAPSRLLRGGRRGRLGIEEILKWIEEELSGDAVARTLVGEIRPLLNHVSIAIPRFSEEESKRIDPEGTISGVCPNFVHSLDACHMRTVINTMRSRKDILGFWAVHDSFGTHAADMEELRDVVIKTFWEMHEGRDLDRWMGIMEGPKGSLKRDYNKLVNDVLRESLRERGLKVGGKKSDLVSRLEKNDRTVVDGGPAAFKGQWGDSTYLVG